MDDDFWWKLNEDDDYIAMFGEEKSSGYHRAKTKNNTMNSKNSGNGMSLPVLFDNNYYSEFNKTKIGRLLLSLLLILPFFSFAFFVLSVIFIILGKLIAILFIVLFVLVFSVYIYLIKLRSMLNKNYRKSLKSKRPTNEKIKEDNKKQP